MTIWPQNYFLFVGIAFGGGGGGVFCFVLLPAFGVILIAIALVLDGVIFFPLWAVDYSLLLAAEAYLLLV